MRRTATTRRGFLKAAAGAALAPALRAQGFPVAGGSNLVCWGVGGAHGYVKDFTVAQGSIIPQLQQMYGAGQRRLAVVVPYFEGGDTFALDSSAGALSAADRASFVGLLAAIRGIGFLHVLIRMIPEWSAWWGNWQNPAVMGKYGTGIWRPRSYERDYSFTSDVWETAATEFPDPATRGIDLAAEAGYGNLHFVQRFWSDWCDDYGVAGTVGYSLIPTADQVANLGNVYANGAMPYLFAADTYDAALWASFKAEMSAAGLARGYLVTETYADDPAIAAVFNADPSIFWWYDWPVGTDTAWGVTQDRLCLGYMGPQ